MKLLYWIALSLLAGPGSASGTESEKTDFQFGMYGTAWVEWVLENPGHVDFLIYQAGPARKIEKIANDMRELEHAKASTIVVIRLFEGSERTIPVADDSVARYIDRTLDVVEAAESSAVRAFSLDEENIFWGGRADILSELYSALKSRDETVTVYQWYSSARTPNVPGGRWPALPADGWVFDQYSMSDSVYEAYVQSMSTLEQPLVSVIWASPNWAPGPPHRKRNENWWDETGWRQFYARISANLRLGIPTAFFAYDVDDSGKIMPLWRAPSRCTIEFVDKIFSITIPYLREHGRIDDRPPAARPAWIPAGCTPRVGHE